jgi:hypothetical protein
MRKSDARKPEEYNRNIVRSLDLAADMIMLASQGEGASCDDGCMTLYGIVRDCAYKIRGVAERERLVHRSRGRWRE